MCVLCVQVSLLLGLLVSTTKSVDRIEKVLGKVLCPLLDHFCYLQKTQGNQKKV